MRDFGQTANAVAFNALMGLSLELYRLHNPPKELHGEGCPVCEALRCGLNAQQLLNKVLLRSKFNGDEP